MPSTYTPTTEDASGSGQAFYQDVEISPATLADGSLKARMDTHLYPQLGDVADPVVGRSSLTLAVTPAGTVVHATSITLTATVVTGNDVAARGKVTFYDGGVLIASSATAIVNGVAAFTMAGGLTAGTHPLTAKFVGDENTPPLTSNTVSKVAS